MNQPVPEVLTPRLGWWIVAVVCGALLAMYGTWEFVNYVRWVSDYGTFRPSAAGALLAHLLQFGLGATTVVVCIRRQDPPRILLFALAAMAIAPLAFWAMVTTGASEKALDWAPGPYRFLSGFGGALGIPWIPAIAALGAAAMAQRARPRKWIRVAVKIGLVAAVLALAWWLVRLATAPST